MASEAYNPLGVEQPIYKRWEASGYFNPDNLPAMRGRKASQAGLPGKPTKAFSIAMPPPNVTGELHLGHAVGVSVQDILTRFHRMLGEKALWLPGTDHAGIATQIMVERLLQKEGISRHEIGRETFLKHVWAWKAKYGTRITDQIRSLGASCDWSREHFTMDPNLTAAVHKAFIQLFNEGLIYRGERLIHWCPRCQTALSDLEVKHVEETGHLYYITYGPFTVATTRPETKVGDTALAVHPDDKRYKQYIGKKVTFKTETGELTLPVIADKLVDKGFGTGVVKVTPSHDPADWDMGQRHHLATKQVIGEDNRMTKLAGKYSGMLVTEARDKIVADLQAKGLLQKIEPYTSNTPRCDRCGTVLQPLLSKQWFMTMKPLAKPAIAAVKSGKIQIIPKRFDKVYFHWMNNIRDWCISRQLWWGHQIPVWYCANESVKGCKPVASVTAPKQCATCKGVHFVQDQDTLDTWFSSGLWTFSTLGWPKATKDLATYHPTSVMETSWDILFFWVARMIMFSLKFRKEVPFKTVYIHGLVLDKHGKKMSKSKGTGIDPLPMAEKYGTDAIRLSLILGTTPGQDFRLSEEKIAGYRNFINKLWNIGNFVERQSSHDSPPLGGGVPRASVEGRGGLVSLADKWIAERTNWLIAEVTKNLHASKLSEAGQALYDFVWHELADWYVEIQKVQPNTAQLIASYETVLKLLHPFAPFVTEALWEKRHGPASKRDPAERLEKANKDMLMIQAWPKAKAQKNAATKEFSKLQSLVIAVRNVRATHKVAPHEKLTLTIAGAGVKNVLALKPMVDVLARVDVRSGKNSGKPDGHEAGASFWLELPEVSQQHVEKEVESLKQYIQSLERKLANENFTKNAPAAVVEGERKKLSDAKAKLKQLSS